MSNPYTRKVPLHSILDSNAISLIKESVQRANHIIRDAYQLLRLFMLERLESNARFKTPVPLINESLVGVIFSVVCIPLCSSVDRVTPYRDDIRKFYGKHYEDIQVKKQGTIGSQTLKYESISIVTNISNHIKACFYKYIWRLVWCYIPKSENKATELENKVQRRLLNSDLYTGTKTCDKKYHKVVLKFSTLVQRAKLDLFTDPQKALPLLYKISVLLENGGKRLYSLLPLKRSFIPGHITFARSNIHESLPVAAFPNIFDAIVLKLKAAKIKVKPGYFLSSFETDGFSCSLFFKTIDSHSASPISGSSYSYLTGSAEQREMFGSKKIVGIDPNKGNLAYCFDGEHVLRYTQNQRRSESHFKKNRHARKNLEKRFGFNSALYPKDTNGNTTNLIKFKIYIEKKNKLAYKFESLWNHPLYRKRRLYSFVNITRSKDNFMNKFKSVFGPPSDVLVVFGNWVEHSGIIHGKESTLGVGMRDIIVRAGYNLLLLDEYHTSKNCHVCGDGSGINKLFRSRKDPRPWKAGKNQIVWGLLRCDKCGHISNRDFNSAFNIRKVAMSLIDSGIRPIGFNRSIVPVVVPIDDEDYFSENEFEIADSSVSNAFVMEIDVPIDASMAVVNEFNLTSVLQKRKELEIQHVAPKKTKLK